jgi:chromosome segregation ATPase
MTGEQIILAVVAAILGSSALATLITMWFSRRKLAAEVDSLEVQTATRVVELVSEQLRAMGLEIERLALKVIDLERRLNESDTDRHLLRAHIERLHTHIDALELLMRREGIDPPPRPRLGP